MRHVLFHPDLKGVSRPQTRELLRDGLGGEFAAAWDGDVDREKVEFWVNPEHRLDTRFLDSLPNLKMLSLAFTGYEKIDLQACRERELAVYYVPGYSNDSVAELAVGLTLALLRRILPGHQNLNDGRWDRGVYPGVELREKKVAVLGTGAIGERTAKLFRAFGCTVVGWARTHKDDLKELGVTYKDDLGEIFRSADVVVLHLPVTDRTRRMVGAELLGMMKRSAVLVNTARSELVDTDALVAALSGGRILGAAIDVFDEEERLENGDKMASPYRGLDNVITTPHLGFKTGEALRRLAERAIENIGHYLAGREDNRLA